MSDDTPQWVTPDAWAVEEPIRCTLCDQTFSGREASYLPAMCERDGCDGGPGRGDLVEVVPASVLADARAENARLREAIERAAGICEDAAAMRCDCNGYYTCGTCPERISTRADDAADVLRAALAPKEQTDGT